jgi:hypothetical protein
LLVTDDRSAPVKVLTALTAALATTAPLGSVTVPVTWPDSAWAHINSAVANNKAEQRNTRLIAQRLLLFPAAEAEYTAFI